MFFSRFIFTEIFSAIYNTTMLLLVIGFPEAKNQRLQRMTQKRRVSILTLWFGRTHEQLISVKRTFPQPQPCCSCYKWSPMFSQQFSQEKSKRVSILFSLDNVVYLENGRSFVTRQNCIGHACFHLIYTSDENFRNTSSK